MSVSVHVTVERSWCVTQGLRSYGNRYSNQRSYIRTDGKKMRYGKALATALLAMVLLSPAQGQGQASCELRRVRAFVAVRKETNASVSCLQQTLGYRCSGLCHSTSTVALRSGALHWKQECECCQPRGIETGVYRYYEFCNDGSKQIVNTPYVSPKSCHCADCWQLFIRIVCAMPHYTYIHISGLNCILSFSLHINLNCN